MITGFERSFDAPQRGPITTGPKKKKLNENLLTNLIPTGGGIAGSLAGAAGGAAIGSVVPVVGTAVGGILGAILGGAGGSALGKVGENAIEGNDDLGAGVGQEALLGGLTSTPIGAGFKLANAGLKAGTQGALGVGSKTAGQLVQEAGVQTIGKGQLGRMGAAGQLDQNALDAMARIQVPRGGRLGQTLQNQGARMLNSQSNITAAQARNAGINTTETFGNVNARTGMTRLDDMAEVSRGLTGAGDDSLLDTITRSAIAEAPGVALADLRKTATALIDDGASLLTDAQRKAVLRNVQNASVSMYGGSKGSLSNLANPGAALDQANAFRATARDLTNSFNVTPDQKQLAKVYNGIAQSIEDGIYSAPGVSKSLPTLIKAGADDLLFRAQDLRAAGQGAQATAYENIAKELGSVKTVSDLRKMKRDFVNIGKIDKLTAQADGARSINGQDLTKRAGEIIRNPFNLVALPLDAATPAIAGAATRAGRALDSAVPSAQSIGQGLPGLAGRQVAGRALTGAYGSEAGAEPSLESALMAADPMAQTQPQGMMQAEQPTQSGYSSDQLGQALMQALAANDTASAGVLQSMYELALQQEEASAPQSMDLNATTAALAAKQATGIQALDQLEATYMSAGGGQGVIGGNLANFAGDLNLNSAAGSYNDQVAGTARQIARAMGEVGAGSDADAQAFISRLPRLTDSPERAAQKLADLRALLMASQQNTLTYGAGTSPGIEQALMQAGY